MLGHTEEITSSGKEDMRKDGEGYGSYLKSGIHEAESGDVDGMSYMKRPIAAVKWPPPVAGPTAAVVAPALMVGGCILCWLPLRESE